MQWLARWTRIAGLRPRFVVFECPAVADGLQLPHNAAHRKPPSRTVDWLVLRLEVPPQRLRLPLNVKICERQVCGGDVFPTYRPVPGTFLVSVALNGSERTSVALEIVRDTVVASENC